MNNKTKLERGIMSTTHVDDHKDMISLDMLEKMKLTINSSQKIRWGIDHNRQFPPMGRMINGDIIKREDHYYLEADYEYYSTKEIVPWDNTLIMESFEEGFPFIEIDRNIPKEIVISVDPNSFVNETAYQLFWDEIKGLDYPLQLAEHFRKASAPVPELVITLSKTALLYQILKPVAKKFGEKLAEEAVEKMLEQGKAFYKFISKTITAAFRHGTTLNQPMMVIFHFMDIPNIELIAKTTDHDLILKGIKKEKLEKLLEVITFYQSKFNIEKIQFVLNEKGKWKFTYLLTAEGAAVGKKEIFKKRDHRYEMLLKMGGGKIYNSVGLTGKRKRIYNSKPNNE